MRWRIIKNKPAFSRFLKKNFIRTWDVEEPKQYPCWLFACADFQENVHLEFVYQEDLERMLEGLIFAD